MTIQMNDSHIVSITQIKELLKVNLGFKSVSRKQRNEWIEQLIDRFKYFRLNRKDKGIIRTYMLRMTGISRSQLTRLIKKKKKTGRITADSTKRHKFPRIYASKDIALLIETDKAHSRLSGPATKRIFEREYNVFKNQEYVRLKNISCSHIYNLRNTNQYRSFSRFFVKTKPNKTNIGQRKKPDPENKPGYLRVDTVHQGDLDKQKGVYHINMVDETTQWEILGSVKRISEQYLKPLLEDSIRQFPFKIINFHSDNGSEYINKIVAKLLNKLLIKQTKSRTRHCNDNALVEGKNASIVRKNIGYVHIPQRFAGLINQFYKKHLNVYLNYHRPCGFASLRVDKKGKQKKVYDVYMTPYERLKSLKHAEQYLKERISFKILDGMAYKESDNECAVKMQKAKQKLFKNFNYKLQLTKTYITSISGSYVD